MIVPMKKVLIFALAEERDAALAALRDLGVMQVELSERRSDDAQQLAERCDALNRTIAAFGRLVGDVGNAPERSGASGEKIEAEVSELLERRAALLAEQETVNARLKALAVWGDFDRKLLDALADKGVRVIPCVGTAAEFEAACRREELHCELLRAEGRTRLFAVISTGDVDESTLPVFKLTPQDDPRALDARRKEIEAEVSAIVETLGKRAGDLAVLRRRREELAGDLEFLRVRDAAEKHGEVTLLSGFVPEPELEKLRAAAGREGWGLYVTDPAEDDVVPVLIRHGNFYTRIIQPLFDFLGIVPGYREIDVSAGVLFFFTIFYAIIIGDAGYGALFLAFSAVLGWKFRRDRKKRPVVALLTLLSVATIVWGALSGQWFGVSRGGIKLLTDPKIKDASVQVLCFVLAIAQLSLGHMWRALRDRSWKSFGANLGWTLIIWGNFFLAVKIIVWPGAFPAFMYYLYGAGLALVVLFSVDWKDPGGVFQFPFNVIGSFTDVLSYIRLFAVGMAGASIALNFNAMGASIAKSSPYYIVFGVLVVLIGHALNLALCVMSVLVHAIRLNTLEFSNHSGLTWSGSPFKPFAKPEINDKEDK
jgi:V/A-type H+-transporting ATPase subunit I